MIEFEIIDNTPPMDVNLIDNTETIDVSLTDYNDKGIKDDIEELKQTKVDKIEGKGLSTNDFTDTDKNKLNSLENYDDSEIKNNIITLQNTKVNKETGKGLSTNDYTTPEKNKLALLENYNDAEIRALIDTKQPKGNYLTEEADPTVPNYIKNITQNNIATWNNKQDKLISGTNIKTINEQSILGSGNIVIEGGGIPDYSDLPNKPQINSVTLSGNKSLNDLGIQPAGNYALKSEIPDVSNFITNTVNDLVNYTLKTNTGSLIDLEINQTNYVVTLSLKDQDGNTISTDTIDLPLENVVVSGSYDETNQKIILTLQSGDTIDIPVGALV